ncbi:MAG: hypothetical protein M1831_003496 [Alyxoria varia]|nr:MAG: hypothetical protein M1831_003496 [Alyxoria varia]
MSIQEILERAAQDGYIDSGEWSKVFESILEWLDQTVYEFPLPPSISSRESASSPSPIKPSTESVTANGKPSDQASPTAEPTKETSPDVAPNHVDRRKSRLPPFLQSNYDTVIRTLRKHFASQPPHTVQRLAELVLDPRRYHRFLPAYINALDRVVSVSSGNDSFPLPVIDTPAPSGPLVNGTTPSSSTHSAAADHSVGGALLTPIPWLNDEDETTAFSYRRRSSAASSDGVDSSAMADESITADEPGAEEEAVTQGELMRREQEEGGSPSSVPPLPNRPNSAATPGSEDTSENEFGAEEHEHPHARGPEVIGLEDTGPQEHSLGAGQVLDMEAAVGRSHHGASKAGEIHEDSADHDNESAAKSDEKHPKDSDGDVVLADVDGVTEAEQKAHDASGDNTAPDAVDATAR